MRPIKDLKNDKDPSNRKREYDIRRDTDEFVTPSITPYDVDYAILFGLTNYIVPPILENGELITVPIRYAAGDTQTQIQRYGYINNVDQKAVTPIISIQRTSLSKNDSVPLSSLPNDIFDGPIIVPKIQKNNQHDRIDQTYESEDSIEYYVVNNPKYRIMSYNLNIWTERMEQMNKIISAIDSHDNMMWGDAFKFRVSVGDFSFENLNTLSERRIVRSNVSLEVRAALLEEYIGNEESVKRRFSVKRVDFKDERSQDRIYIQQERIIRPATTYIEKLRRENDV